MKQFAQNFGVNAHEQMWSRFSCKVPTSASGVADFGGSGKHSKPDCLVPDTCTILEFKPNRGAAIKKGEGQLADYASLLKKFYENKIETNETPDSKYGGQAVIDTLKSSCYRNGSLNFRTRVETYDICDMKYECTN